MLKILEEKMNSENDKWLEEQLSNTPQDGDDSFTAHIMEKIDHHRARETRKRQAILTGVYLAALIVFIIVTPWSWLGQRLADGQGFLTSSLMGDAGNSSVLLSSTLAIVISLMVYFVVGEAND